MTDARRGEALPDPGAQNDVLCVEYSGPAYPWLVRLARTGWLRSAVRRLLADSDFRRNPRSADYMATLVRETFGTVPAARIAQVSHAKDLDERRIAGASGFVLLWQDGNGCGWSAIERRVFRHRRGDAPVSVLNGRRRRFALDPARWRQYRFRRFLEKSLFPEMVMFGAFWIVTPCLALWDLARFRK